LFSEDGIYPTNFSFSTLTGLRPSPTSMYLRLRLRV
jgi:hypothetical protein